MIAASFEYRRLDSEEELLELLGTYREASRILAGGQALIADLKRRTVRPSVLLDVTRISALASIEETDDGIRIGAAVTFRVACESDLVRSRVPLLSQVAGQVGDPQLRNVSTLAGSVCDAHPAADLPATLVALDAEVDIVGPNGCRRAPVSRFIQGAREIALEPDHYVRALRVPLASDLRGSYRKVALCGAGYALVGVAALVSLKDDIAHEIRVGVTGVGVRPCRASSVEEALRNGPLDDDRVRSAVGGVAEGVELLSDERASAAYRAHLAAVLARRAIAQARHAGAR